MADKLHPLGAPRAGYVWGANSREVDMATPPAKPVPLKIAAAPQNVTIDLNLDGQYRYGQFGESAGMQEEKAHFNTNATLRGGWQMGASVLNEAFGYPAEVYTGYRLELPRPGYKAKWDYGGMPIPMDGMPIVLRPLR